jgi:hypothetical protein
LTQVSRVGVRPTYRRRTDAAGEPEPAAARDPAADRGRALDQADCRDAQVSVKTIETHRTALMAKLDLHDVAGLVRYAIRIGLVSSES